MESELIILNKYLKKMFPFIIEVENYVYEKYRGNDILELTIYVSPIHFCELMDNRIENKLRDMMIIESSGLIKSVLPEFKKDNIRFLFYPDIDKVTIFDDIPVASMPI
jgi:hypothetical protein